MAAGDNTEIDPVTAKTKFTCTTYAWIAQHKAKKQISRKGADIMRSSGVLGG